MPKVGRLLWWLVGAIIGLAAVTGVEARLEASAATSAAQRPAGERADLAEWRQRAAGASRAQHPSR